MSTSQPYLKMNTSTRLSLWIKFFIKSPGRRVLTSFGIHLLLICFCFHNEIFEIAKNETTFIYTNISFFLVLFTSLMHPVKKNRIQIARAAAMIDFVCIFMEGITFYDAITYDHDRPVFTKPYINLVPFYLNFVFRFPSFILLMNINVKAKRRQDVERSHERLYLSSARKPWPQYEDANIIIGRSASEKTMSSTDEASAIGDRSAN